MIRQPIMSLLIIFVFSSAIEADSTNNNLHITSEIESTLNNATDTSMTDLSFWNGVASSFSMIFTSEILDKSFFIVMVMAMRHSRMPVYAGAVAALGLMTVLSASAGMLTTFIPRWITYYLSAGVMFIFAIKMFYDAYKMNNQRGQENAEEVEKEVEKREKVETDRLLEDGSDGSLHYPKEPTGFRTFLNILMETFMLTFIAEWGDRSQIATVLLAATENVFGVLLGGVLGHAVCTAIAVLGGQAVSRCITVRIVTIIGGCVFLLFAVLAIVFNDTSPLTDV